MFTVGREGKSRLVPLVKLAAAVFLMLSFQTVTAGAAEREEEHAKESGPFGKAMLGELAETAEKALYGTYMPGLLYALEPDHKTSWILQEQIDSLLPFYGYLAQERGTGPDSAGMEETLMAEREEENGQEKAAPSVLPMPQEVPDAEAEEGAESSLQELLKAENEAAMITDPAAAGEWTDGFVPHNRQAQVDLSRLENYETLVKEFYTVDANTMAGSDQLNVDSLTGRDMSIAKDGEGPQILIYHTHSQEGFADSVPGDDATNIQAVGEHLAQILENTYGYRVLHHTGEYDIDGRDDAYANALPGVERVLAENPSIQVVIDLHRDQMPEQTRLVTDLDGRPTARFMFFNGLSRTKTTGDISYLYNENLADNLAFSFQMQLKAAEYYPGLTRKIYLKGYRYNMHLRPRTLLIELGAQNNTLEEAMNACDPLAHILDMVLSGE